MNKKILVAALAGMMMSASASAATPPTPHIYYTPNVYTIPTWTTAKIFKDFESSAPTPGESYSYTSPVSIKTGALAGSGAASTNHYLSIGAGGTFTVSFAVPEQFFSFAFDSLASLDQVVLTFADSTSRTLSGAAVLGLSSATSLTGQDGRVSFDMGGQSGIKSVEFLAKSDCSGFNIDGLAAATPEPGTWGMMILGFGLVGGVLRRRRTPAFRLQTAG